MFTMKKEIKFSRKIRAYTLQVIFAVVLSLTLGMTGAGQTLQAAAKGLAQVDEPPSNDDILSATDIALVSEIFDDNVDTTTATTVPAPDGDPEPMVMNDCNSNLGERSVWYHYQPTTDINLYVDTIGSDYDTILAVWEGSPGNLTLVACNDDNDRATTGLASKLGFFAKGGVSYYIEVIQYSAPAGTVVELNPDGSYPYIGAGGNLIFHVEEGDFSVVEVHIGDEINKSYAIPSGENVTPMYEDTRAGPVQTESMNGVAVFASERSIYKQSFNEVMGYPGDQLTTEYWFPWYDNVGMTTWVLVGNPSTTETAEVDVYIGEVLQGSYTILPGEKETPKYQNTVDGPVRVVSTNGVDIFASERSLYKDSFNEVMGYPGDQLTTEYWFPWYDNVGMKTWVLVGKP
jgi:hypothetical protein